MPMNRNAFMVDLLRPELSFDETVENLRCKAELTNEDLEKISQQAEMISRAAIRVLRTK